jgi:K+-sensing histidine kinase KdpD
MTSITAPIESQTQTTAIAPAAVARLIHDDLLQSLGVAVLGVDLGRRLHQRMRYEQALAELTGIVAALEMALASSEQIVPVLQRMLPRRLAAYARPTLRVMTSNETKRTSPPATSADEIVTTLSACLVQARRCHHQYDAGLGEETMRDLELLLQRLEFVSAAFREVMGQLRELSPAPIVPQPRLVSWVRSA